MIDLDQNWFDEEAKQANAEPAGPTLTKCPKCGSTDKEQLTYGDCFHCNNCGGYECAGDFDPFLKEENHG